MTLPKALNIDSYKSDGFVKVCDVHADHQGHWFYRNINQELMFSPHNSWFYFIVSGKEIVKGGNTGHPLGIRSGDPLGQPMPSSDGRIGRYRKGDGTDRFVREGLETEIKTRQVSFWVRKLELVKQQILIAGQSTEVICTSHADVEMRYLDYIFSQVGYYPRLNKGRK